MDYFFNAYGKFRNDYKFTPDKIFNVNKIGVSVVPSLVPQVLYQKGKRQMGALTSAESVSLKNLV